MSELGNVTVEPTQFDKVEYDAGTIAALFREVAAKIDGIAPGTDIHLEIDQEEPTPRVSIRSLDPVVFHIESGALEETKQPRSFGPTQASLTFARLLIELVDRTTPAFGSPELGQPADLAPKAAWEVSCIGRATRLGFRAHKPRFLYNFRNRFGFSDAADAELERIWSLESPTWSDIVGSD